MLASALRRLHDVPVSACPFDFGLPAALAHVETRLRSGLINSTEFTLEFAAYSAETAVAELRHDLPAVEDPVITHGDYCVPNVVFDGDLLSGFVDVGELGVADRWRDLAVATWSIGRNIGPGWEELFLRTYGVEPDPSRMRFYRLLYELAS
jgi:aminoglycoside 3'-phosphotransferase-2